MIDPDILMLKAIAEALDHSGLSPAADDDDAKALIEALRECGYEIKRVVKTEEEKSEN